jgi:BirA family transcriptional regulator, biotin operon repressor / biotin---[acetyl-CoA-carboxylase] ligase
MSYSSQLQLHLSKVHFHRLKDIRINYLDSVDSTQAYLSQILKSDREGDVVISNVQSEGKGREGRSWESDSGGLWMTIVLRPPAERVLEKTVYIAARAVVKTFEEFGVLGTYIKPPNDVFCNGKKIAGVLADTVVVGQSSTVYLGVGIDVNNDTSRNRIISAIATSALEQLGRKVDLSQFTSSFLKNLDEEYNNEIESCISTD